ncbi:MAG TPA: hypothetical protein VK607_25630, partial [Kofleriaceae bacterium]|nr:hypothetical protein [Kofleriaceae bacterium]
AVEVRQVVPAIAAELRIRYQLERVYRIRRAARFLRARGKSIPPFPAFPVLPVQPEPEVEVVVPTLPTTTREIERFRPEPEPEPEPPVGDRAATQPEPLPPEVHDDSDDDLLPVEVVAPGSDDLADRSQDAELEDDLGLAGEPEDELSGRERRTYVRTIADEPSTESERQLLGRIAIRKIAVGSAPRLMAGATLGEATRAIRRSTDRDRVADLVIDTLDRFAPACEAAILLVIRGGTAIGWKGFQRAGSGLGEIAVPIDDAGLVPRAVELNVTLRRSAGELAAIDRLLLTSLGRDAGDLVVVPIAIAEQVMCVIAIATAQSAPIACAEPIAAAAGAAFARLMRDASR